MDVTFTNLPRKRSPGWLLPVQGHNGAGAEARTTWSGPGDGPQQSFVPCCSAWAIFWAPGVLSVTMLAKSPSKLYFMSYLCSFST